MKTPHLDEAIENLLSLRRHDELSSNGHDNLAEFQAIKKYIEHTEGRFKKRAKE